MHIRFDGKPVTSGDNNSVAVMFNNLSGASFVNKGPWPGYIAMMNAEFFAENPLKAGTRVDLVCHGLTYASFVYGSDQIVGVSQDDIARVYQENQPRRLFSQEDARAIYDQVCVWRRPDGLRQNPFCPHSEYQKFQAFAWGRYRVLTGEDFLQVRKLHAAAQGEQERALYTEICAWSPWYGDEHIGARLKEDLFLEPSPF